MPGCPDPGQQLACEGGESPGIKRKKMKVMCSTELQKKIVEGGCWSTGEVEVYCGGMGVSKAVWGTPEQWGMGKAGAGKEWAAALGGGSLVTARNPFPVSGCCLHQSLQECFTQLALRCFSHLSERETEAPGCKCLAQGHSACQQQSWVPGSTDCSAHLPQNPCYLGQVTALRCFNQRLLQAV